MSPVVPIYDRGEPPPDEGPGDGGQGSSREAMSRWEKLTPEERKKKKRVWEHRQEILEHYEIQPFGTPPRNPELDVTLEDDYGDEDQEDLDDLEHEEMEEREAIKAKEIQHNHDCEGLVCPFVIEDDDGDVRCMMQDQIDKRELLKQTSQELLEAQYGQQLRDDIIKDDPAIRTIQANIAARGKPEDILRKFLLQENSNHAIRSDPALMGHTISMSACHELNKESRTDVIWSGPGGKPGKTVQIYVRKGNTRITATIIHKNKDDGNRVDEDKSTQGQISIFQKPNNQFLQFKEPNEPGIHRWQPSQIGTKAREHLRLIAERIENIRLQLWMKLEEGKNGAAS